MANDDVTLN